MSFSSHNCNHVTLKCKVSDGRINNAAAAQVIDGSKGVGNGNTALAYHAGRLLALNESDLPYHIRTACNGIIETVGRMKVCKPCSTHSYYLCSSLLHAFELDSIGNKLLALCVQLRSEACGQATVKRSHACYGQRNGRFEADGSSYALIPSLIS